MSNIHPYVGSAQSRVDGPAKVTGAARYAAEFPAPDLAYGYVVSGTVAKGRITRIATTEARQVPGVIEIFTHENRPRTAWFDYNYHDEVGPPGHPFRPLYDDTIHYSGQPIALVVAESFEIARFAASLVSAQYESQTPSVDVAERLGEAYVPPKKRSGISPPPSNRGDADAAFRDAPVRVSNDYRVAVEHHNPMEMHATTVIWNRDNKITVHDKIQGVKNSQSYIAAVFGMPADDVHVVTPFLGGGFGAGLRPQYQLFLAVMAALQLKRSVRLVLTRDQMFTFSFRPDTIQTVSLGATTEGKLVSLRHDAVAGTSQREDHQEVVVNWSGLLYDTPNAAFDYKLTKLDTHTPSDMRAPGAVLGVFAIESAMDELAFASGVDPVEMRLRNYAEKDENQNKPFTSKELRAAIRQGAERFGWAKRTPEPRSMRDGRELVGYGFATGAWESLMQKTSARASLSADGKLEVGTSTSDIGTGTYTILAQISADALGLPIEDVTVRLGDSSLPTAPVEGGSWTAASAGTAVENACATIRETLLKYAKRIQDTPLAGAGMDDVVFEGGRIALKKDRILSVTIAQAMNARGKDRIEAEESAAANRLISARYSSYTHSAVFAEVRIDEDLGVVRVTRVVSAIAAGRILNTKTARSQILGGVVMGIGAALEEESMADRRLGRFMNHNYAEYHIPVNADIQNIEVIFVEEHDNKTSPIGVKGLGEIGIVGTAGAIANAVFHATGKRVRHLPITIDKLL